MLLFANVIIPLKRILISFSVHGSFSWRPVQDDDMSTENLVRKTRNKERRDLPTCVFRDHLQTEKISKD